MQIEDFGKKIGGARKDIWGSRGLYVEDLTGMNEGEIKKYVTKGNIWLKPDYQALYESGLSRHVVYYMKAVRDSIMTKPVNMKDSINYISFVTEIRDIVMNMKSDEDIPKLYQYMKEKYEYHKSPYNVEYTGIAKNVVNRKLFKAFRMSINEINSNIKKTQFLYSEEEKILSNFVIFKYNSESTKVTVVDGKTKLIYKPSPYSFSYFYEKNGKFSKAEEYENDTYIIIYNSNILSINHETLEIARSEAIKYFNSINKTSEKETTKSESKTTKKKKTKFIPERLERITRNGENYRNGHNIDGKHDMLNIFKFYGGEFGNWMNENDRQADLNMSYDAFVDLAKALNIAASEISFRGILSIAYGSRGSGNAMAHYEPLRSVINLTKMKGAGCLAHEWGHALDHYLGTKLNNKDIFLTESNNKDLNIYQLLQTMKYKKLNIEDSAKYIDNQISKETDELVEYILSWAKAFHVDNINQDIIKNFIDGKINSKEETTVNDIYKLLDSKIITNGFLRYSAYKVNSLQSLLSQKGVTELTVETDFYKGSQYFDDHFNKQDKGYWASDIEMFARAFDCYVKDKLTSLNIKDDYLCGYTDSFARPSEGIYAIPIGEERKLINKEFDRIMSKAKELGLFTEYNKEEVTFEPIRKDINFKEKESFSKYEQFNLFELLEEK